MKRLLFFICILLQITQLHGQSKMDQFDHDHQVIELCGFGDYTFSEMKTSENIPSINSCLPEDNFSGAVSWIKFPIEQPGYLEFILSPKFWNHDLDFELYNVRLDAEMIPGSLVRCNANGATLGEGIASNEICLGSTGMKTEEALIFQYAGCTDVISNFVIPAYTKKDEIYYLKIINQSGTEGFSLSLGGTSTVNQDQDLDFTFSFNRAKSQFEFQPLLSFKGDNLKWDFGLGAEIIAQETNGKVAVKYEIDGPKTVTLTEDSEACYKQIEKIITVSDDEIFLEGQHELLVFPNPVATTLNLTFEIQQKDQVSILLHSVNGSVLYFQEGEYTRGTHHLSLDCQSLLSGTYIVEMKSSESSQFQKIIKVTDTK